MLLLLMMMLLMMVVVVVMVMMMLVTIPRPCGASLGGGSRSDRRPPMCVFFQVFQVSQGGDPCGRGVHLPPPPPPNNNNNTRRCPSAPALWGQRIFCIGKRGPRYPPSIKCRSPMRRKHKHVHGPSLSTTLTDVASDPCCVSTRQVYRIVRLNNSVT
jgi:hypothetical protein